VNIKTTLKTSVAASALLAVVAPVANAEPWDGGTGKVVMSGQVVRGLMYAESGTQEEWFQGDGGSSASRLRWIATRPLSDNVDVKAYMELNAPLNDNLSSASLDTVGGEQKATSSTWGIRHYDIKFSHKQMGALSIGQGNTASNSRMTADYSGVGPAFSQGAIGSASAIEFYDNTGNTFTAITASSTHTDFDGRSRDERIRYDLPKMNGLSVSVGTIVGDGGGDYDMGASYTTKMGDMTTFVGGQINSNSSATSDGSWGFSAGMKHPSGFSLQGRYGTRDNNTAGASDPEGYGVLVGYQAKIISAATTNFAFQYINTQDLANDGDDAEVWMVGASQGLGSGVTVHASYRNFSLDQAATAGTDLDDISSFFLGTVVKF